MVGIAAVAVGASGGRFAPAKPTITYVSTGTFSISNYDASLMYTITPSSGTASRSGATITLNSTDMEATVTAGPPKGGVASASVTIGRKPLSTFQYYQSVTCASGDDSIPGFWILMPYECGSWQTGVNPAPANYVTVANEYRRIT